MKRVIVAVQNTLISEAILYALKKRGVFVEKSLSGEPDSISSLCSTMFADVLLTDVNRTETASFEARRHMAELVKRRSPEVKVCFICDNASDPEIAQKVKQAKIEGSIDAFFYESVQADYLCDVVDSL